MAKGVNAKNFTIDLKKFGKLTREKTELIFRKIALDLDTAIVLDTPVDTGRARGNWYPSLITPSNEVDLNSFGAQASITRLSGVVAGAKLGSVIWMTNNLDYIVKLENGHSRQAAEGMVVVNVVRAVATYGGSIST